MLFYGDEAGYTNDYSYLDDPAKSYDNRWMHRPVIDWEKNKRINKTNTVEHRIFSATQKLLAIRKKLPVIADYKNLTWLNPYNIHVAAYLRTLEDKAFFGVYNFSSKTAYLTWAAFKEHGITPKKLYCHWTGKEFNAGGNADFLVLEPYGFHLLEVLG